MRRPLNMSLLLLLFLGATALSVLPSCADSAEAAGDREAASESDREADREGDGPAAAAVVDAAAVALCGALYRCCPSDEELARFFAPVATSDPDGVFADVIPRVPPNAPLSADECPSLVAAVHRTKGIGPFAAAAAAGEVDYDAAAAQSCLTRLDDATCGDDVTAALFDGTCFGLSAPLGGDQQRSMFTRTATDGTCHPLADGFGGILFGTCDPTTSFCCIDDGSGACGFGGTDDVGTCAPAAQEGEACSAFAPVLVCATGLECIPEAGPGGSDGCVAPSLTTLADGDVCYDESVYRLLGDCVGGWCDATGTNRCEPRRVDGAECQTADQCVSLGCVDGICGVDDFCAGG